MFSLWSHSKCSEYSWMPEHWAEQPQVQAFHSGCSFTRAHEKAAVWINLNSINSCNHRHRDCFKWIFLSAGSDVALPRTYHAGGKQRSKQQQRTIIHGSGRLIYGQNVNVKWQLGACCSVVPSGHWQTRHVRFQFPLPPSNKPCWVCSLTSQYISHPHYTSR